MTAEATSEPASAICVALRAQGVIVWRSGIVLNREAAGGLLLALHTLAAPTPTKVPFLSLDPVVGEKALKAAMIEMDWLRP